MPEPHDAVTAFEAFVDDPEYVEEVYLDSYPGCLPEHRLGEDLLGQIAQKMRWPLAYAVERVCARFPDLEPWHLQIVVEPRYDQATSTLILHTHNQRGAQEPARVLYFEREKAWHYRFDTAEQLAGHLVAIEAEITARLTHLGLAATPPSPS